jgi:hypothetical protein
MKRLLPLLLLALLCPGLARAGEKANTVLVHPGEVVYAEFARKGVKLTLVKAAKEPNDRAQIIVTFLKADPAERFALPHLKVENKFDLDLDYQAQVRSLTANIHTMAEAYPVVGGKMSQTIIPPRAEEIALYGWVLEK